MKPLSSHSLISQTKYLNAPRMLRYTLTYISYLVNFQSVIAAPLQLLPCGTDATCRAPQFSWLASEQHQEMFIARNAYILYQLDHGCWTKLEKFSVQSLLKFSFFQWLFQPIQGPGLLFSSVIDFHRR
jgi:hypothetical protein